MYHKMIQPQYMKFRLLETYARAGVMDDIQNVPISNHAVIIHETVCIFNIFLTILICVPHGANGTAL